jgi:hypothetical protein
MIYEIEIDLFHSFVIGFLLLIVPKNLQQFSYAGKNTFEYSMKMVQEEKNGSLLFFFFGLSLKNRFLLGGQRSVKYFLHFLKFFFDLQIN